MKVIVLILVIFFCKTTSYAQLVNYNTQVLYKMTFQKDSTDKSSFESMEMELLLGDNISLFQSYKDRKRDSVLLFHDIKNENVKIKLGRLIIRPVHKFSYRIVKHNQKIDYYDSLFGLGLEGTNTTYNYREDYNDFEWVLSSESDSIYGYLCQKAELKFGGRKWSVWFTSEIPISDGPYKFCGLPGLIIKAYDEKKHWAFDLMSIKSVNISHEINFQKWYDIQKVTKNKFFNDRREFEDTLPAKLSKSVPQEVLEKLKNSIKIDNNWIELYP